MGDSDTFSVLVFPRSRTTYLGLFKMCMFVGGFNYDVL
jgi:hypothetical protein